MPTENRRVTFLLEDDMLKRLEGFRFQYRLANMSQAVLLLIQLGLVKLEEEKEAGNELIYRASRTRGGFRAPRYEFLNKEQLDAIRLGGEDKNLP